MHFPVKYSISDIERLSGINAATIRVWERRYKLIEPKRTKTNIRYYDNDDLKFLMNISSLQQHGGKISQIASMTKETVAAMVRDIENKNQSKEIFLSRITKCLIDIDAYSFREILIKELEDMPMDEAIEEIIVPILDKIGVLWQTNIINPAQEHFASNIIRDTIILKTAEIEQSHRVQHDDTMVLFLPDNELHEIGLLIYRYLLIKHGYSVLYLGQAVPIESIPSIIAVTKRPIFITSFTNAAMQHDLQYAINRISKHVGEHKIFITGPALSNDNVIVPNNIIKFGGYRDLIQTISEHNNG